ncbi:MAG TPA: hypothetical protein VHV54_03540 [Candidatus Binatia bacterium]|nr:hypothetical protein [Candidatus Binatia bacterium]
MIGDPAQFEAIGNRLGFRVVEQTPERLRLLWQGPRFPAFLCLGIALLLLFVSVPIVQALHIRGFVGPAASLWYFPLMNLILFGIAIFLVTQRRVIEIDSAARQVSLTRRSFYRTIRLTVSFDEISTVRIAPDHVYSGFALAGSTAAQTFPIPALRMIVASGASVLLDRGSVRRLKENGKLISERINKPLEIDAQLQT